MVEFNEGAKLCLEEYLKKIKEYLRHSKTINVEEVTQNIIDHIEEELGHTSAPVSVDELNAVLEKLGSPERWISEDDLPLWRKVLMRLHFGPEDWRLSYFSFVLLIISLCLLPQHRFDLAVLVMFPVVAMHNGISFVLFIASFILARAVIRIHSLQNQQIVAQKWLVYPTLILMYLPLTIVLLLWPIPPLVLVASDGLEQWPAAYNIWINITNTTNGGVKYTLIWIGLITFIASIWWIILSFLFFKKSLFFKKIFFPFLGDIDKSTIKIIMRILVLLMFFSFCVGLLIKYLI